MKRIVEGEKRENKMTAGKTTPGNGSILEHPYLLFPNRIGGDDKGGPLR